VHACERKAKSEKRKAAEAETNRGLPFFVFRFSLFVLACSFLQGCTALGVAAYKLHGPPKVPAEYVPEPKPMLVLVENYQHQSSVNAHADLLGRMLVKELEARRVAPIVPLDRLQELRDARPRDFQTMSMSTIGREIGAEQILYVQLHNSDVTPMAGGNALTGQTSASVKVVDVATGDTLWPGGIAAEAGHPVAAATKLGTSNGGNIQDVRQRMYVDLSHQIARLFYKWQPENDEPEGFQS
jgi:hypothetical protein